MERGSLAKTNAILTEALEGVPDPVILVDPRRLVSFANAAARHARPMLQIGSPLFFTLRMPDLVDAVERVMAQGVAVDLEIDEKKPIERAFRVKILPLPTGYSAPERDQPALMLMLHDLTSERRLEHMRVDFVANASHELRTPLASLLGFIETLQGPAKNDTTARERFLEIMRSQARRMTRLIDDLLSLSRVELNAHRQPVDPVDLAPLVEHMAESLMTLAKERGVVLNLSGTDRPFRVAGDVDELSRVIENLIENAIKYGQSGGRVDVGLSLIDQPSGGQDVCLEVRDYGAGIPAEHLPRLTERFYRVDVSQSREKGGTGLGLALVKHIVSHHRGRLQIDSQPGQGAVFRVLLPHKIITP